MWFAHRLPGMASTARAGPLMAARLVARSFTSTARPAMSIIAPRSGLLGAAGAAVSMTTGGVALAESKGWPGVLQDMASGIAEDPAGVVQEAGPVISVGTACGFCSGFVLKKAGKIAAGVLGGVFIGLQGLASQGIITINWDRTTELFGQFADVNGDGKVDKADADAAIKELQARLTKGMGPAAGGFGVGLLLGLRYG